MTNTPILAFFDMEKPSFVFVIYNNVIQNSMKSTEFLKCFSNLYDCNALRLMTICMRLTILKSAKQCDIWSAFGLLHQVGTDGSYSFCCI